MLETGGIQHVKRLIAGDYEIVDEYVGGVDVPMNPWAVVGATPID